MHSPDSIETLYDCYSGDVYRYLLSLCRNSSAAEDLLQSTFLQVVKGITGFRGGSTIKTWIFTIARHEYFRWLKKNPPAPALDESFPSGDHLEENCERREQTRKILNYLSALEEPHHSLMALRLMGGFSFREIGEMLGKTEVWARVTFMRDKCKLLEELKEELE